MTDVSLTPVLRLLQAAQLVEMRFAGGLSAVHGLSVNEALLLMQLERAPNTQLPRVELAKRLNVSASTVTRMTAPMEKCGLVGREADARDARLALVTLTKAGALRIAEAKPSLARQAENVFRDRWTKEEVKQLSDLLGRLVVDFPGSLT